jgi:hypothetical protein
MGYEDPADVADHVARSASKLADLLRDRSPYLSDDQQREISAILSRQFQSLDDMSFQIGSSLRNQERVNASLAGQLKSPTRAALPERRNLPVSDQFVGVDVVKNVIVWQVRRGENRLDQATFTDYSPSPAEAEIVIYLDQYDEQQLERIQAAAVKLGNHLGYEDFAEIEEQFGSIWRVLRGKLRSGIRSAFVQEKMRELDMRASLEISGRAQAEIDAITTSSVVELIASLADIPNAVVRVGGILVVKQTVNGGPAAMIRPLSAREIRALELNPGIQKDPGAVLHLLAAAVAQLEEDERARAPEMPRSDRTFGRRGPR